MYTLAETLVYVYFGGNFGVVYFGGNFGVCILWWKLWCMYTLAETLVYVYFGLIVNNQPKTNKTKELLFRSSDNSWFKHILFRSVHIYKQYTKT